LSAGLLVIGYGNTLRGDDGAGQRVAEAAAQLNLAGVRVLACAQLTPELAESIAGARAVVFVDAAVEQPRCVRLRRIRAARVPGIATHTTRPQTLLALARTVYGRTPRAWLLTIPAENLDLGETLSATAQNGVRRAIEVVQELARIAGGQ